MSERYKKKLLLISFCVSFLYSLHVYLTLYTNAIYFEKFFSKEEISLIYTFGGIFAILFSIYIAKVIRRIHNYTTTSLLIFTEIISLLLLAYSTNVYVLIASFITHLTMVASLLITINLFIEEFEDEREIGATRGIFITLAAMATILATLIAGAVLNNYGFSGIYIASAIIISPTLYLLYHYYKNVPDPKYQKINIKKGIQEIFYDKNIFGIFVANFALQAFYVVMTVYSGIYLLQNNITIQTFLTFILPIALMPFILLPHYLGNLADKKTGEKEFLIFGLVLMGIICVIISFIDSNSPVLWAIIFFVSRIGASIVEEMSNSYFYKKAHKTDSVLLSMFGNIHTLSLIVTPLISALILIYFDLNWVFFFLGIFIFLSILPTLKIVDTR